MDAYLEIVQKYIGVGIPRGLEAAIYAIHHYISQNASDSTSWKLWDILKYEK